jgi:hypothetical protein
VATFLFNNLKPNKMNTYSKILTALIVSFVFIISSCTKDGGIIDTVYGCMDSTATNYNPLATIDDSTCTIEGCTDSSAMNYNVNATSNDGSCVYAYDIAQGTWNITPNCEDINLPIIGPISLDTILPESIDVQGAGNGSLFIDINGAQISGEIDNSGNITIAEQTVSIDLGLGIPIPVQISGSGKIESENSGYMDLTFSGEIDLIPGIPPVSFNSTCHITLSK